MIIALCYSVLTVLFISLTCSFRSFCHFGKDQIFERDTYKYPSLLVSVASLGISYLQSKMNNHRFLTTLSLEYDFHFFWPGIHIGTSSDANIAFTSILCRFERLQQLPRFQIGQLPSGGVYRTYGQEGSIGVVIG
ncbi:hypothetical protein CPB83DRAFT_604719 [Crepidotus variabilis]|uniref:Uncharacterized protein n=1 Tax=Crepidotus variabilis TaxID=179855 RepID=A0A9P6E8H4_9AGAR|nr:hypothetical protein CPB83DRAFT_604719 [Crepidotus variabilis]